MCSPSSKLLTSCVQLSLLKGIICTNGVPLGIKAVGELLTTGIDYTFDTNFTRKLDEITEEFLNYTGEPETLAGQITQFGTQFAIPFGVVNKLIANIGKLKPFVGRTMGMRNSKLVNKNRFIQ